MILIFGPTGSGKSMQGKLLATRNNWRWISAGQLLRDENDTEIAEKMQHGDLIDPSIVNEVVNKALSNFDNTENLIMDGYPRAMNQATYIIESLSRHKLSIKYAIVLDVPRHVLFRRLLKRGRMDDNEQAIESRLNQYDRDIPQVLDFLMQNKVPIIHINGDNPVGRVHDDIMQAVEFRKLI